MDPGARLLLGAHGDRRVIPMAAAMATRSEVVEALARKCRAAKREQHITRRFTTDAKTVWDEAHEEIDAELDRWELVVRG